MNVFEGWGVSLATKLCILVLIRIMMQRERPWPDQGLIPLGVSSKTPIIGSRSAFLIVDPLLLSFHRLGLCGGEPKDEDQHAQYLATSVSFGGMYSWSTKWCYTETSGVSIPKFKI